MAKDEKGYVYILTNPAFRENWVKIGKSSRPVDVRSKELDNTAVPLPFQIYATMCTIKYAEAEKLVHKYIERFTNLRIRNNREFFNVKPEEALEIFYDVQELLDDAEIEVFQGKTPKPKCNSKKDQAKQAEHIFYCRRAGSDAKGFLKDKDETFVVLAGSVLRGGECDSLKPQFQEKRQAFIEAFCKQEKGQIILEKDFTFPSPSAAAVMMVGGNSNGWTRWKDAEGKTLDEVYRQTNHEATEEASTHETTSSSVKDKTGHTNKKDKTRYSIDGKTFTSMSACLREFITLYINQHKNITFYELKLVFNDALLERRHRVRGLLFKKDDYDAWTRPDKAQRYGANHENAILTAPDGIQFYVNTQWTQKSFRNIIKLAKKEGIKILASA